VAILLQVGKKNYEYFQKWNAELNLQRNHAKWYPGNHVQIRPQSSTVTPNWDQEQRSPFNTRSASPRGHFSHEFDSFQILQQNRFGSGIFNNRQYALFCPAYYAASNFGRRKLCHQLVYKTKVEIAFSTAFLRKASPLLPSGHSRAAFL
jgi:hypothetical protein